MRYLIVFWFLFSHNRLRKRYKVSKEFEKYTCSNCVFFERIKETKYGKCHRFPPQTSDQDSKTTLNGFIAIFPNVKENEWCGEMIENKKIIFL